MPPASQEAQASVCVNEIKGQITTVYKSRGEERKWSPSAKSTRVLVMQEDSHLDIDLVFSVQWMYTYPSTEHS